jgi:small GTP-binding protein
VRARSRAAFCGAHDPGCEVYGAMAGGKEFKVVMVGAGGVGKTSLVNKLSPGGFSAQATPTIGAAYVRFTIHLRTSSVTLNIWDTAGQEKFYSLVPLYMRNAHGLIFVFDVASDESLQDLDAIYDAVHEEMRPDTCALLCANKFDLVPGGVDLAQYKNWGQQHGMQLMQTSAKTGDGVLELFTQIAQDIDRDCAGSRQRAADNVLHDICHPDGEPQGGRCC